MASVPQQEWDSVTTDQEHLGGSEWPGKEALGSRSHAGWKFRSGGDSGLSPAPLLALLARDGKAQAPCLAASPQGPAGWRSLGKGLQRHTSVWLLCARQWGSRDSAVTPLTAAGPGGRLRHQSLASSCHEDAQRAEACSAAGSATARALPGACSKASVSQTHAVPERASAGQEHNHAMGLAAVSRGDRRGWGATGPTLPCPREAALKSPAGQLPLLRASSRPVGQGRVPHGYTWEEAAAKPRAGVPFFFFKAVCQKAPSAPTPRVPAWARDCSRQRARGVRLPCPVLWHSWG